MTIAEGRAIEHLRIHTAGAFVRIQGRYLFALGARPHHGRTPVIRLGGHREGCETGWQCALREVYEETRLRITPLAPAATYFLPDGDRPDGELEKITWQHASGNQPAPLLAVAYQRQGQRLLSLMYLAQTRGFPTPSSEIQGCCCWTGRRCSACARTLQRWGNSCAAAGRPCWSMSLTTSWCWSRSSSCVCWAGSWSWKRRARRLTSAEPGLARRLKNKRQAAAARRIIL